jgi:hypothetical protein
MNGYVKKPFENCNYLFNLAIQIIILHLNSRQLEFIRMYLSDPVIKFDSEYSKDLKINVRGTDFPRESILKMDLDKFLVYPNEIKFAFKFFNR